MEVTAPSSATWAQAPEDRFTGSVSMAPLNKIADPGLQATVVRFEPGAHTYWHSHAEGQVLHILSGYGQVVSGDGTRVKVTGGDVVTVPPGEVHWHGASADSSMTHISVTAGDTVWSTEVSESDYSI